MRKRGKLPEASRTNHLQVRARELPILPWLGDYELSIITVRSGYFRILALLKCQSFSYSVNHIFRKLLLPFSWAFHGTLMGRGEN